ncbi:MAG: hypothetical protein IJN05_11175 [Ruminococcus sp.]|nr:hypothetical protein [Ruminococcus sp.]
MKNDLVEKIKELSQKPAFLKAAVALGILMIILILISDLSADDETRTTSSNDTITFEASDIYADNIQEQLTEILTSIEGVGKADVMLTITSTEEYVYAETIKQGSSQAEKNYVIIDKGSQKEALVKKINNPSISGIVVVCEGGDDPRVCEKVYKAVSTALNISTTKIYVTEMK